MKLDRILEYQKLDQELLELENTVSRSEVAQKFYKSKNLLVSATSQINALTAQAKELLSGYAGLKGRIDALTLELNEFDGITEGVQDALELDHYLKMIGVVTEKLNALEKEAKAVSKKLDEINADYLRTMEQGKRINKEYAQLKEEYNKLVSEHQPRANAIQARLKALRADIPENIMEAYLKLRNAKTMPALVEFDPSQRICGRCRMELANDTFSKLKNPGDVAECPNCRRILYVPES